MLKYLETRYKDELTLSFLEEGTSLDARFKHVTFEATWSRLLDKLALHGPFRVNIEEDQSEVQSFRTAEFASSSTYLTLPCLPEGSSGICSEFPV
jgi:hypothetical protein